MKTDFIEVNDTKYIVKIFPENRSNSSVSIGKQSINIRVPLSLNREEQFKTILKMKLWAKERLKRNPPKPEILKEYKDGDKLSVGNKEYVLSISYKSKQSSSARIQDNLIILIISSEIPEHRQKAHVSTLLSRIIGRQRLPDLEKKLKELNERHFQSKFNKIFFKNLRSRWGSCSRNSNINISTKLLFAPDDILGYVCVHELAHLIEFNHSDKFWELVERAMPDYKEKEQWLKQQGENITF